MVHLDDIIENDDGPERKLFEQEMRKLSEQQLQEIVVAEGIFTTSQAKDAWDFELQHIIGEARWSNFFDAYYKVMGYRFSLDRRRSEPENQGSHEA